MGDRCPFRVGFGYDIHRLVEGRPLLLGGVRFESPVGLLGHSDADVVCHALADALLGASNLGDIGVQFPPSDPKWQNANSLELLRLVMDKVGTAGGRFVNADITVVAEAPRINPRSQEIRVLLAGALGTDLNRISIKATTNEGQGPEGQGLAISATAICLISFPDA